MVGLGKGLDLVTTNIVRSWPITLCPTQLIVPKPRGVLRTQGGSEGGAKTARFIKWFDFQISIFWPLQGGPHGLIFVHNGTSFFTQRI